jgi:hypothetical protein
MQKTYLFVKWHGNLAVTDLSLPRLANECPPPSPICWVLPWLLSGDSQRTYQESSEYCEAYKYLAPNVT